MSMNPELGHLYHDYSIWNEYTALDAKEKLKTREINARESKYLEKYSSIIDRAKSVCKQQNEREQMRLRSQLQTIQSKTPSLNNGITGNRRQVSQETVTRLHRGQKTVMTNRTREKSYKSTSQMSSWSVSTRPSNTTQCSLTSSKFESQGNTFSDRTQPLAKKQPASKCASFVKKADHVTKSLQRLYTKSKERKNRESNVTVLDILGKESKHELETALFLLRGSAIGDAIEEILKNREKVSKQQSVGLEFKSDILDTGEVTTHTMLIEGEHINKSISRSLSVSDESVSNQDNKEIANGSAYDLSQLNTGEISSDGTIIASSTVANPSENEEPIGSRRWTELFRAPELWKLNTTVKNNTRIRPMSLVTLAGKHRQTMLK